MSNLLQKIDCFIVGAQKCGTTSLYNWLNQHPEIGADMSLKDYHFFLDDKEYKKGHDYFEDQYGDKRYRKYIHCAVNYMYMYNVAAKRIYEYNEGSKIIIIIRDPIKRAFSAYLYFKKKNKEKRSFLKAINADESKYKSLEERLDYTYLGHGHYSQQIKSFLTLFGCNNVKILFYEELFDESCRSIIMKDMLMFIGVKDVDYLFNYNHLNKAGLARFDLLNNVMSSKAKKDAINSVLPYRKMLSKKSRASIRWILNELNYRASDEFLSEEDYEKVKEMFIEEYLRLEEVLGKRFRKLWRY